MAEVPIPIPEVGPDVENDPPADVLLERLEDEGGTARYEELVKQDTLQVRQTLDALEIEKAIERRAVGRSILVELLVDDIEGVSVR